MKTFSYFFLLFVMVMTGLLLLVWQTPMYPRAKLGTDASIGLPISYGYNQDDVHGDEILWLTTGFRLWAFVLDILITICLPLGICLVFLKKQSSVSYDKSRLLLLVGIISSLLGYAILVQTQVLQPFGFFSFDSGTTRTQLAPNDAVNEEASPRRTVLNNKNLLTGYVVEKIWELGLSDYPRAFAIDSNDNMYVSEGYQGEGTHARILKYDKNGALLGWLGKGSETTGWHGPDVHQHSFAGTGDGEFYYIFKIVFVKDDTMYVLDRDYFDKNGTPYPGNARVQKFDTHGNFLGWLGKGDKTTGWHGPQSGEISAAGEEAGALDQPTCLLLHNNDLLISSWVHHKVDKFNLKTGMLSEWLGKSTDGTYGWHMPNEKPAAAPFYGREPGAFNNPFDCKLDSKERLYVLSYDSDPVIGIFDYKTGAYQDGLFHSQGYKPANIILDKYDNVIMSDNYEGSVRLLNRDKQQVAKIQLGPGGDYFGVGDFAFDSQGYLFFLEKMKGHIYKVKLVYE